MTAAEAKAIRKRLGLTQAQLACALALSPDNGRDAVRRWEAGKTDVRGPTALALRYMARYGLPETAL